ncbi:MAG: hypothetical protein KAJ19_05970 [Gammaproteobacteria bacterium]|nr:hypothetical protein [Gammaproteobacteria bacterium]
MDDAELIKLENSVDELIETVQQLKEEKQSLLEERGQLLEKTELAQTRIETIIGRLKAMEQES